MDMLARPAVRFGQDTKVRGAFGSVAHSARPINDIIVSSRMATPGGAVLPGPMVIVPRTRISLDTAVPVESSSNIVPEDIVVLPTTHLDIESAPEESVDIPVHVSTQEERLRANANLYLPDVIEKRRQRTRTRLKRVGIGAAIAVCGLIMAITLPGGFSHGPSSGGSGLATMVSPTPPTASADSGTEDLPPPNYLEQYKVDAAQAKIVTIPSLNIEARVLAVGVDGRGQPRLPIHAYDAGWYNVSSLPGTPGTAVLSGSCSTSKSRGVFAGLAEVRQGDTVSVERGDGSKVSYIVKELETVPVMEVDMTDVLSPVDHSAAGLNIVTCTGSYNPKTNDYSHRLIVLAARI